MADDLGGSRVEKSGWGISAYQQTAKDLAPRMGDVEIYKKFVHDAPYKKFGVDEESAAVRAALLTQTLVALENAVDPNIAVVSNTRLVAPMKEDFGPGRKFSESHHTRELAKAAAQWTASNKEFADAEEAAYSEIQAKLSKDPDYARKVLEQEIQLGILSLQKATNIQPRATGNPSTWNETHKARLVAAQLTLLKNGMSLGDLRKLNEDLSGKISKNVRTVLQQKAA